MAETLPSASEEAEARRLASAVAGAVKILPSPSPPSDNDEVKKTLERKATAAKKAATAKAQAATKAIEAATAAAAAAAAATAKLSQIENQTVKTEEVQIVDTVKTDFASLARQLNQSESTNTWSLVQARSKKKIVPVIGTSTTSILEGVAPPKRDFWELSVSRLKADATCEKLKTYLQGKGIEVRDAYVFTS